jgi:hypothetical protein
MAKAPAAAVDFDGSGKVWFKILDMGPTFSSGQAPLYGVFPCSPSQYRADHPFRHLLLQHPKEFTERRLSP